MNLSTVIIQATVSILVSTMQIFVRNSQGDTSSLNVESCERICSIKRKLKENEGIRSDLHLGLMYNGELLDDGHTLAHYNVLQKSTLHLFLSEHTLGETWTLPVRTWSDKRFTLNVQSVDTIDDVKAKIQKHEGIPPHNQLLFRYKKWLEDGSRTLADYDIDDCSALDLAIQFQQAPTQTNVPQARTSVQSPLHTPAPQSKGVTAARSDLMPGIPPTQLEDLKREMATARTKEKELMSTISGLTQKNRVLSAQFASYVALKAQNKKTKDELTVARNKEKEQEATLSQLTHKNKEFSAQCASFESQVIALEAENKKTKDELMAARSKEKEQETTVSRMTHRIKLFSTQCASYESQVDALEVENKITKEELMNADKKYYAGARAAGYAEGLKEAKSKWLKSVEFLHRLTDASMHYFDYGFDSCQKQAEEQGFSGQLDKDIALKGAPELKGWESSDQPH